MSLVDDEHEGEPPTESMHTLDARTTAGTPATLQLHHLHGLLAALEPLRAAYASAAVDRLRGVPLDARRAILPHLLREHPGLTREPRLRALAEEVLLDADALVERPDVVRWLARLSGVRATRADDALARTEQALVGMATTLAELVQAGRTSFAEPTSDSEDPPDDPAELLAWALEPGSGRAAEWARVAATLLVHASAAREAARDAAEEVMAASDPAAIEAGARVPRWWPTPFREAALWSRAKAQAGRRARRDAFEAAFARAYRARIDAERDEPCDAQR